jgi:probable phosphoglycerate mutase
LLCIARHGETDWNAAGILQGWTDIPLNDGGRRKARQMATSFADAGFSVIWSSPLVRAMETAEIIAAALGLPRPRGHEGLRERHFGRAQGVPKAQLAETDPLLQQGIMRRDPATDFGGETMDEFADRVLDAVAAIGAMHRGERALVIIHGWVMDVIVRQIDGLPRAAILGFTREHGTSLWLEACGTEVRRSA